MTFEEVASKAYSYWESFPAGRDAGSVHNLAGTLFDRRGRTSPLAMQFANYAASKALGTATDVDVYFECLHSYSPGHWEGRPASWLWKLNNQPAIYIDSGLVHNSVALPSANRAVSRLILHETGHIVLHWNSLLGGSSETRLSTPVQEKEAWWFASCIVGLALGHLSEKIRTGPPEANDSVWPHA